MLARLGSITKNGGFPVFEFVKREVEINGEKREHHMVEHPGGAGVLAIIDDKVVLVRQFRHPIGRQLWEVPAGIIDPGEEPIDAAKRELAEETGYTAQKWTFMGKVLPVPGYSSEWLYLYLAEGLTPGNQRLDESEELTVHCLPLDTVLAMLDRGEITDGKTVILLLKYMIDNHH